MKSNNNNNIADKTDISVPEAKSEDKIKIFELFTDDGIPKTAPSKRFLTSESRISGIEKLSVDALDEIGKDNESLQSFYTAMAVSKEPSVYKEEAEQKSQSYLRASLNLHRASAISSRMADETDARINDLVKSRRKKRFRFISHPPANAYIDLEEQRKDHFAHGLNIYKLLLILYIGSFVGVIIELLWCLVNKGYFESRSGLVYGPFNLLYGIGAVAITAGLYKYRNRSRALPFAAGMIIGSLVEYVCSWAQEMVFGSRSWDYTDYPFNLNGRICILYSVFWGVLGVFWLKNLYPRLAYLILKIPNKIGRIMTWVLLAFFVFNAAVSVIALLRWGQRIDGIQAANDFWRFIDLRFPDERMQRIYCNMIW
ncbi:MAG: putative ABC transporter permease [Eubacteriales bacterium]|jgi:uncharacterized membrane protein